MNQFAIAGARKPGRTGFIAIMFGALLGAVAAPGPARSADLSPYAPYAPYETAYRYSPGYSGYYRNCCACNPCCHPCGCYPCGVVARPAPVVERHWDYWERRYPVASPYPRGNRYSSYPYYPGGDVYPSYPGESYPGTWGRPRLGFGGVQYPPAPISDEYETAPRPRYEYEAAPWPRYEYEAPRPRYEYDAWPRPRLGMRGGYSSAGYIE